MVNVILIVKGYMKGKNNGSLLKYSAILISALFTKPHKYRN